LKSNKEQLKHIIEKGEVIRKEKEKKLQLFNKKVYKRNKFQFYKDEYPWNPVFINLEKYNDSNSTHEAFFSSFYSLLLYDFCEALELPYLFSFIPSDKHIDNDIFIKETSAIVKNKNIIIRKSAYLLHLVRVFEENDYNHSAKPCVNALFDYDDINTIEVVRNVLISYFMKAAVNGESPQLKIFKKNTKEVLKRRKAIEKKKLVKNKESIEENNQEILIEKSDSNLLSREQARKHLKTTFPTLHRWTKQGKIISYGIGGRVYYKKDELDDALDKLKS
jgi:hypothetical protein